ncbi:MAG: carbohydrate ABC transporter permease [Chloroflexales bacterium]|nr:carbohydrate ABC transporter permease [Chloroflexales bacterium]
MAVFRTRVFSSQRNQAALWQAAIHAILLVVSVACLVPLALVVAASLSDEAALATGGYSLLPRQWSLAAYQYLFADLSQLAQAYIVTTTVTVVGTAVGLLVMALLAYALSRRSFSWRVPLTFAVFFTMLFNGGLVPWYILITQYLHLKNTLAVLILPYLVVPWFVLLLRTYFAALPGQLLDAARIDGAGEWRIFFQIVVPLSTPALATVGLFCALQYWNDWWLALLFIDDNRLVPLQYLLQRIMTNAEFIPPNPFTQGMAVPVQTVRMAMAVLAVGPIVLAFLFVQKYFVRGITLGGVKDG